MTPGESARPGVVATSRDGACQRQLLLGILEHREEDALLVLEVVVEGALRHAGATHQILDRRIGKAFRAEALPGHRQQPSPCGLGSLLLRRHRWRIPVLTYI